MRARTSIAAAALLASMLALGCDSKETTTPKAPEAPAAPTAPAKTDSGMPGMGAVSDAAKNAQTAVGDAAAKGKEMAADLVKQAEEKIQQVKDMIAGAKFTDADSLLKQLEGMQDKLPQNLQDQIKSLRQQVTDGLAKLKGLTGQH
jgi:hypothetical protein